MDLERAQSVVAAHATAGTFSGVVRLERAGDVLLDAAVGLAHRGFGIPNRSGTRFRAASIGKLVTAVATLQLIDQGLFALDTRVVDFLDLSATTVPRDVTVYHLLTMTSGIADWFDEESDDWEATWNALVRENPVYNFRTNADYLPLFVERAPLTAVGETWRYNGAGYLLLGLMIAQASGRSYFDVAAENVLARAGMVDSGFPALDDVVADVAEGYVPVRDGETLTGWRKNIYSTTAAPAADGGLTTTAPDLCRFSRALRGGDLLSPAGTRAMLTPHVSQNSDQYGYDWRYGFGNMFLLQDEVIVRWGHTGEEDGVSGRFYHYPQENVDLVVLGNQSWCAGKLAWQLHDVITTGAVSQS